MSDVVRALLGSPARAAATPIDMDMLPIMSGGAYVQPYQSDLRDTIGNAVYDAARYLGLPNANRMREDTTNLVDFVPLVGDAVGVNEAARDFNAGNYGMAAAGLGLSAAGLVPGLGDAAATVGKKGIRAYHGSPHDFDAFRLDKIGTGEGAQAYGHGLYFAENERTAQKYRDDLSPPSARHFEGNRMLDGAEDNAAKILLAHNSDVAEAREYIDRLRGSVMADPAWLDATLEALQRMDVPKVRVADIGPQGRMYEVSINAAPDDFLDWERPLSEQPEKVREWFDSRGITPGFAGQQSGNELFQAERRALGDIDLARNMRDAGIAGVKYLDHGSRFNAADGLGPQTNTRNYVVFDDALIEIVRKYSIPVALGAGLITEEMARQMQEQGIGQL